VSWTRRALGVVIAAAAVVIVVVLLTREDEPDAEPRSAEEQAVIDTIDAAVETRNADDCERLATPAYLVQTERLGAGAALAACRRDVFDRDEGLIPDPVVTDNVANVRRGARADITFLEGTYAGLTARVRLKRGAAGYQLDRVESFPVLNRAALERGLRAEIQRGPYRFPRKTGACAVVEMRKLSDQALAKQYLSGSPSAVYGPVVRCDRAAVVNEVLDGPETQAAGPPAVLSECARTGLASLREEQLIDALVDPDRVAALRFAFSCDPEALLAGYRRELVGPRFSFPPQLADCVVAQLRSLPASRAADLFIRGDLEGVVKACRPGP
jgi:hypothetical protein